SDGTLHLRSPRGSISLRAVARDVMLMRISGHSSTDMTGPLLAMMDKLLETPGELCFFADAADASSYDPAYRQAWPRWFLDKGQRVQCHLYVRSKIIAMGISVLNLAVGRRAIIGYSARNEFDAEIRRRAPGADLDLERAAG